MYYYIIYVFFSDAKDDHRGFRQFRFGQLGPCSTERL